MIHIKALFTDRASADALVISIKCRHDVEVMTLEKEVNFKYKNADSASYLISILTEGLENESVFCYTVKRV